MNELDKRIAGLPEWPDPYEHSDRLTAEFTIDAALARLALAREWIEQSEHHGHLAWCELAPNFIEGCVCACGRDALLKALEVPRG
jgi:hypothetical protein